MAHYLHKDQKSCFVLTDPCRGTLGASCFVSAMSCTNDCSQGPAKQSRHNRYSGLWEIYYDEQTEEGGAEGERGKEASMKEGESKNIRGFLLKRRKSPLKGWHKVREGRRKEKAELNQRRKML